MPLIQCISPLALAVASVHLSHFLSSMILSMASMTNSSDLEGGINANQGGKVIACAVIFIIFCSLFLVLRFLARHAARQGNFFEDWLMIPAYLMMMGLCANVICSVLLGEVGRHQDWVLLHKPSALVQWAQALFVTEVMYGVLIATEKTSILIMYFRIFRIHRWFRVLVYSLIAYVWAWAVSELLVAILQCQPIAYQWDISLNGTCIDRLAFYRWISVPNIIHDVAMLVIPAPMIWKLQISKHKKMALSAVFLLASFGCVASAVRMYYFFKLNALSDKTWASIHLMSWTCAEPGIIFICGCMPALWPVLRRVFNLKSTTGQRSDESWTRAKGPSAWNGMPSSGQPVSGNDDFILLQDFGLDDYQMPSSEVSPPGQVSREKV